MLFSNIYSFPKEIKEQFISFHLFYRILFFLNFSTKKGTEEFPKKSVVNRVALQLQKALCEKGIAFLVNHGISEEKV